MTNSVNNNEPLSPAANCLVESESTQPHVWAALWEAMKAKPHPWICTTNDMYWSMLQCVPPKQFHLDGFLVGEADHHNDKGEAVYACFMQRGDMTKARYMTVKEFNALTHPAF